MGFMRMQEFALPPARNDPDRCGLLSQVEVVELLDLRPGMAVAEMGAGEGRLTSSLSNLVGPEGRVYAIETEPKLLANLHERRKSQPNIQPVGATWHDTGLANHCSDRVLMANLLSELSDPVAVLHEAARLLRETGRLFLIDWRADGDHPPGPPLHARVGFPEIVTLLENHSWDIHRHGSVGSHCIFIEASVSDEGVQS
jgi:ubiquinone/menaquinone biosynthesis C-methylase UbiE